MNTKTFTKQLREIVDGSQIHPQYTTHSKEEANLKVDPEDDAIIVTGPEGESESFILHIIKVQTSKKQ